MWQKKEEIKTKVIVWTGWVECITELANELEFIQALTSLNCSWSNFTQSLMHWQIKVKVNFSAQSHKEEKKSLISAARWVRRLHSFCWFSPRPCCIVPSLLGWTYRSTSVCTGGGRPTSRWGSPRVNFSACLSLPGPSFAVWLFL